MNLMTSFKKWATSDVMVILHPCFADSSTVLGVPESQPEIIRGAELWCANKVV
jgi:hypothetical protein